MDVVVLVPRRPEPWRDKLWRFVHRRLAAHTDWPIYEGLSIEGPFNRSAAINEAARQQPWDVAVVLDADTVIDFQQLSEGVELAAECGRLVLPHNAFRSLARHPTQHVLAGKVTPAGATPRWVTPETKSSCLCISRPLWEETGGFDERFEGWGAEDAAFYAASRALAGIERISGPVHHLWHPRSAEKNPDAPEYKANFELAGRYKTMRRDPDGMRAILGEPGGPLNPFRRGGVISEPPAPPQGCVVR